MRPLALLATLALVACSDIYISGNDNDDTDTGVPLDTADTGGDDTSTETGDTQGGDTDTSDTDSGIPGGGDSNPGDDTGPPPVDYEWTFDNHQDPGCLSIAAVWPGVDEDGAWAAARFQTGSSDTIVIDTVDFTLLHGNSPVEGVTCDASQAYELRMMVGDTVKPPEGDGINEPATVAIATFPATSLGSETERVLVHELASQLVIGPNKQIHVALNSTVDGGDRTCFKTCAPPTTAPPNNNWWSSPADPKDWSWVTLDTFGGDFYKHKYWVNMYGYYAED